MSEDLRLCPTCLSLKGEDSYSPSSWRRGQTKCRDCINTYNKARWERLTLERKRELQHRLPEGSFNTMLERQHGRCLGCLRPFSEDISRISVDHDHRCCHRNGSSCGKCVRGLLCQACNVAIGLASDDPQVLRRLMAYLATAPSRRDTKCVYVIGSLRNPEIPALAAQLRETGLTVWDDWHSAGEAADDAWRDYERGRGHGFSEALSGHAAQNIYLFDRAMIDLADAVVLVMPAGKSAHLEFGYAVASGKPGYVLLDDEPDRFDVMTNFATQVFSDQLALVATLKELM